MKGGNKDVIAISDFHDGFRVSYVDFRGRCREGILSGLLVDSILFVDDFAEKP